MPTLSSLEPGAALSTAVLDMAARRVRKKIVVDASVLIAAAGVKSIDTRSDKCLEFLSAILDVCHHVVATGEIYLEWDRHLNSKGLSVILSWRKSMLSKRKISEPDVEPDEDLRRFIATSARSRRAAEELQKDVHLIEACRCEDADLIIASTDDRARREFSRYAQQIQWLGRIIWVNPATDTGLVEWLADGAPSSLAQAWRLSYST